MTAAAVAIVLLILVSEGICEIQLKGFEGGGLLIKCRFDNIYNHKTKTFCKREDKTCPFEKRGPFVGRNKEFNVVDEGYYVVFITQLALTDTGDYRCAVENEDEHIDVTLNIKQDDSCKGPLTVMIRKGKSIAIPCKYPKESKDNTKVFCKQGHVFTCSNLIEASSGRFTVIDDHSLNVFTVSIRNVSRTDPGIYWCGVRTGANTGSVALITEVHLKDLDAPSLPPSSSGDMPLIIGVCLTVAVLTLVIAVFIFLKYKHQRTSNATSSPASAPAPAHSPGDPDSRTPRDKKRVGDKSTAHADCEYEIKGAVRPPSQQRADSAATSDSHPADPSEGPSYATVHFRKHPEQQTDAKATAESLQEDDAGCEYAAIKYRC